VPSAAGGSLEVADGLGVGVGVGVAVSDGWDVLVADGFVGFLVGFVDGVPVGAALPVGGTDADVGLAVGVGVGFLVGVGAGVGVGCTVGLAAGATLPAEPSQTIATYPPAGTASDPAPSEE
jgi:hypothetical protein